MLEPSASPKLWLDNGVMIYHGSAIDAQEHSHNAIQITWPIKHQSLILGGKEIHTVCVIAAQQAHSLSLEFGWVILIEPQSSLGELITHALEGSCYRALDLQPEGALLKPSLMTNADELLARLEPMWQVLNVDYLGLGNNPHLDSRIGQLVQKLDQCLIADCIKPESWLAVTVAQSLGLSEGRFLHLFKQEMKIAWRPYLLWRRLLCAVNVLKSGRNATEAAYIAGFSDSAHLSRTFKKMFGLTIRQAQSALIK